MKGKLFTNQSEVDRAIRAAVDQCNEIYSNNTITNKIANAWVDVNMKYHAERDGDPKLQGWYDAVGKLLLGWQCS